ncbi:MAG: S-layer protein [Pedosphaera sp. Tous-C6FEB]|nr:MAG: S-layer protein [Pedosphaera sp. Tous-C6FEB]
MIKHSVLCSFALAATLTIASAAPAPTKTAAAKPAVDKAVSLELFTQPADQAAKPLVLSGADARVQLLATARHASGAESDYSSKVTYTLKPLKVVEVDKSGYLTPIGDGVVTISAKSPEGLTATASVSVENFKIVPTINFANSIVPIFTKAGCNGGGCHGKSGGQNGFRLSLLGFEPQEDYEYLVKEARGRRLSTAAPDTSLFLLKGAGVVPHGGGTRLDVGSYDYNLIKRWIAQGMPYGDPKDAVVTRIEVFPKERTMQPQAEQQLKVIARYSDGRSEDVTRGALFEANDKDMATAEPTGLVKFASQPGDVGVMVRYQSKVAVFRATVPLGAPVQHLPIAKNFIDESVFKKLKRIGLPPSEIADDATFIRRLTLDLAGRLPNADETTAFLADKSATKRDALIDRLLASGDYADYFANFWGALLRNQRSSVNGRTEPYMRGTFAFHSWIRDSLASNKPYDQFAREVLAASGDIGQNPPVAWYRQVKTAQNQLEDTAQLFLGLRLQCAQCHHHPYEKWSQADYYSFGAFFSQVSRKPGSQPGEELVFAKRGAPSMANKKNNQPLKPAGLGETPLDIPADEDARHALADWLSKKDNTFFAHSLVNRYWKHFFNRGLVEPEDDMRETNPPVNPELLDALAKSFIESGFDLKKLVRNIVTSSTYQLSAIPNSHNAGDKQNFSRYYPKRLSAEVLFDAINTVTKSEANWANLPAGTRAVQLPDNSYNSSSYFLQVFGRPDSASACACERSQDASLAQSLHLLNSKDIQAKLTAEKGRAALLAADEKRTDEAKVNELYLWAFSRQAESSEATTAKEHIEKKVTKATDADTKKKAKREAYEDIVWALVSSKEFLFNH